MVSALPWFSTRAFFIWSSSLRLASASWRAMSRLFWAAARSSCRLSAAVSRSLRSSRSAVSLVTWACSWAAFTRTLAAALGVALAAAWSGAAPEARANRTVVRMVRTRIGVPPVAGPYRPEPGRRPPLLLTLRIPRLISLEKMARHSSWVKARWR